MPPQLLDVLDACPTTKTWKTRPAEPHLAGLRDRALLLVGFFAALRRSELAALAVDQLAEHPNGLVLSLPRSKTNQYGLEAELVVLPRTGHPGPLPGHRPHHVARRRCHHRRHGAAPDQQGQPAPPPPAAP
jgi:hypothetical protein